MPRCQHNHGARWSPDVSTALAHARSLAHRSGGSAIEPDHVLAGLVLGISSGIVRPVRSEPIDLGAMLVVLLGEELAAAGDLAVLSTHPDAASLQVSPEAAQLLSRAMQAAWEDKTGSVTTSHLGNALRYCTNNTVSELAAALIEGSK
ncbi:MAG TPA: hypothetical protein PLL69_01570 [Gemmatimonadales bacterium]|nr:hypothetical protein [Gemmatimonadales bacterium]